MHAGSMHPGTRPALGIMDSPLLHLFSHTLTPFTSLRPLSLEPTTCIPCAPQHELAIDRMRVEATLQKQAMVAAEHERARIRVQEERGLAMEREAQERRLQKARAEGEGMIAREKAVVEAELLAKVSAPVDVHASNRLAV